MGEIALDLSQGVLANLAVIPPVVGLQERAPEEDQGGEVEAESALPKISVRLLVVPREVHGSTYAQGSRNATSHTPWAQ
ncbi:hypothetical protein ASG60_17565 [Methylobacterium sp. Leaf469]|nr:hypothetical protein ASG60_17565 [Methylobacterium sp. Leaf469]